MNQPQSPNQPVNPRIQKLDRPEFMDSENRAQRNIINLWDNAEREGANVYQWKGWLIVANSSEAIELNLQELERINSFQEMIDPQKLWGQCIYVHEAAELYDIATCSLSARMRKNEEHNSIYPIRGIHCIAVKDTDKHSIYFDLTSRVYSFTPEYDGNRSLAKGVIIIDRKGRKALVEEQFQCDWERSNVDRSPGNQEYIQYTFDEMKKK